MLGCSNNLDEIDWFKCGGSRDSEAPFFIQDTTHIATKLRNHFLKTMKNPKKTAVRKLFHTNATFNRTG